MLLIITSYHIIIINVTSLLFPQSDTSLTSMWPCERSNAPTKTDTGTREHLDYRGWSSGDLCQCDGWPVIVSRVTAPAQLCSGASNLCLLFSIVLLMLLTLLTIRDSFRPDAWSILVTGWGHRHQPQFISVHTEQCWQTLLFNIYVNIHLLSNWLLTWHL